MTKEEILLALDKNGVNFKDLGLLQKYIECMVPGTARANPGEEIAWVKDLIDKIKAYIGEH